MHDPEVYAGVKGQPIRDHLAALDVRTYAEAIRKAQLVERSQLASTVGRSTSSVIEIGPRGEI